MPTVDDQLHTEQVQKEKERDEFYKEIDDIIYKMLQNNSRLQYMYNQGWPDTREAIKEAIGETIIFFKEN